MVIDMYPQNYCMVDNATNICVNVVAWDGNPDSWTPPANMLMLVQSETPSKLWMLVNNEWALTEVMGEGQIGFTWDGIYLITPEPKPEPPAQPAPVEGAQTL